MIDLRGVREGPEFRVQRRVAGSATVVEVFGEVDVAAAPELEAALREATAAGSALVDLSGVSFMDSSGIRLLDALLREGGELRFVPRFQDPVRQVLEMTGMLAALPTQDDPRPEGP